MKTNELINKLNSELNRVRSRNKVLSEHVKFLEDEIKRKDVEQRELRKKFENLIDTFDLICVEE